MPDKDPQRTVRLGDGQRTVTEGGETIVEPLQPTELAIATKAPKVTKTQARAAANMRIAGAGYDDIASFFDYRDAATARQVVEEAIANAFPEESREALRQLTSARLQGLMRKIAAKTEPTIVALDDDGRPQKNSAGDTVRVGNPEQLAHIKVMADLIHRHARIMGVEQFEVLITPSQEQQERVMKAALAAVRSQGAQEADPFAEEYMDAEVVEPEDGELDG